MKTQASGYPSNVTTHEQMNKSIRQYEKHEGVHLDPNKIENNPGLRSIGKLALNSIKTMILRDKLKANVYTLEMPKSYSVVYNKCIIMDDYITLPYGF